MMIKTFVVSIIFIALISGSLYAIPALQLYLPTDSHYDPDTESWITYDNPFTLQVIGASHQGNIEKIRDLYLFIAVPEDWWSDEGGVTISGPGVDDNISADQFILGTPDQLSKHGIYPTYYYAFSLPDMDFSSGTDTVYNYNPGEYGEDQGLVYDYTISYSGFFGIHMDAAGVVEKKNGKSQDVVAPYSHDADAPIPEPSTLILIGFSLVGGMVFKKSSKCRRNRLKTV